MGKYDIPAKEPEKKILIVDDDPIALEILEKTLISEGYWVAKAINGQDALYMADVFLPDVIILDVMMPIMDGAITLKNLERNPRTRNIPVLFLTSLISKAEESTKFIRNKCVLAKPVDKDTLLREITKCIEKAH